MSIIYDELNGAQAARQSKYSRALKKSGILQGPAVTPQPVGSKAVALLDGEHSFKLGMALVFGFTALCAIGWTVFLTHASHVNVATVDAVIPAPPPKPIPSSHHKKSHHRAKIHKSMFGFHYPQAVEKSQ